MGRQRPVLQSPSLLLQTRVQPRRHLPLRAQGPGVPLLERPRLRLQLQDLRQRVPGFRRRGERLREGQLPQGWLRVPRRTFPALETLARSPRSTRAASRGKDRKFGCCYPKDNSIEKEKAELRK